MNESNLNRMIREHKARIIWFLVFLILAVFVTALVFGTLKRSVQAQTYTKRVFACSYAQEGAEPVAHQHNDDCYENGELICTLPERELHIHGDECYAEEKVLVCTLEEGEGHVHTDACYTEKPVLICTLEENDGHVHSVEAGCYTRVQGELICTDEDPEHVHTDECYAWEEVLTCEIPEGEGAHHHSEECYETQRILSCGKEEGEGAHTHDDTCYEIQKVLICDKEEVKTEHVHTVDCFQVVDMSPEEIHALHMSELPESDPTADVESPDVWESRFASVPLSGHWDRDLLKIAETQLGYTESQRNFDAVLDENGETYTLKGWTRYGAWYGIPYGDWCAMFISFCLNYADIPESAIPYDCATTTWIDSLSARGMYAPAGSYDPKPGDLIFFDWEGDGLSDHVGIVWAINPGSITTIEGNHTISVELFDYDLSDGHIQGYGILPENPALAVTESEENESGDKENPDEAEGGAASAAGASDNADPSNNNVDTENTEKTELDPETLAKMPPFSYSERVAGMRISIEANEGAFPEGTTVTIKPIEDDGLAEQVAPAISGQVVKVQAVDITFYDADGNEIEPRIPIRVTMRPFTETEADNVGVVHVGSDGVVSAVETQKDVAQPDQGIAFSADSFSTYALVYTVTFAYDGEGNVYQYSMPGGTGLSLRELLIDLGMKTEDNVDSYLSHVVNVAFSKPDCMTLTKEGNDWLLQSVHAFDTPESLTVAFDDFSMLAIPVSVSGIEELQLENASISSADGVFLPEGTEGYANVVEDAAETISAVEDYVEKNTPEPTLLQQLFSSGSKAEESKDSSDKAYQVFDIGLDNIDADTFKDGFNVEVKLPENVVGKDFHLYHIHDNNVEEIDLKLASAKVETGSDLVSGFSFQTDSFSQFALSYTVDFEYMDADGNVKKWSFPGRGSYPVSLILEKLGVEGEVKDASLTLVEALDGTDEKALYLEQKEDRWYLTSDVAFDDKYELTLNVGEQTIKVFVTDAAYELDVKLHFTDGAGRIPEASDYYVLLDATDGSNHYYKAVRIAMTEASEDFYIPITGAWSSNQAFSDTWQIQATMIKPNPDPNFTSDLDNPNNCSNPQQYIYVYNLGEYSYADASNGELTPETGEQGVDRKCYVFNLSRTTGLDAALTPRQILGDAVEFGIVADTYVQSGHTETNFAVNTFNGGFGGIDVDGAGTTAIPFYAGSPTGLWISGGTLGKVDLFIPENCDDVDRDHPAVEGTAHIRYNDGLDVSIIHMSSEDIGKYVNNLITSGRSKSTELARKTTVTPALSNANNKYLDFTQYPDGKTIYVNCDNIQNMIANGGWNIIKLENQSIVFNLSGTDVSIGEFYVTVYDTNGVKKYDKVQSTTSALNGDQTKNLIVDNVILRHITFNAYNATKVSMNNASALFLAPNANEVTQSNGAGWILAGGKVNSGSEWHFYYHDRKYHSVSDGSIIRLQKLLKDRYGNDIPYVNMNFSFKMTQTDAKWNALSGGTEAVAETGNDGYVKFNAFTYSTDQVGYSNVFYYVIEEQHPESAKQNVMKYYIDGIEYNDRRIKLKVVAQDNGENKINCTYYAVTDDGTVTQIDPRFNAFDFGTFENRIATGKAEVKGKKEFSGYEMQPSDVDIYSFTLSAVTPNAPLPSNRTQKIRSVTDPSFSFGEISFSSADLDRVNGIPKQTVFEYKVEESGSKSFITNDTQEHTVKITVTPDTTDYLKLNTSVKYYIDDTEVSEAEFKFVNTYEESGGADLTLKKVWEDGKFTDADKETVTYQVYQVAGTAAETNPSPSGKTITVYVRGQGKESTHQTITADVGDKVTIEFSGLYGVSSINDQSTSGHNPQIEVPINSDGTGSCDVTVINQASTQTWIFNVYYSSSPNYNPQISLSGGSSASSVPVVIEHLTAEPKSHSEVVALGGTLYTTVTLNRDEWGGKTIKVDPGYSYYAVEVNGDQYEATYQKTGKKEITVTNHTSAGTALTVVKLDADTNSPLSGAEFTLDELLPTTEGYSIRQKEGDYVPVHMLSGLTDKNVNGASVTFESLRNGYYRITETTVPAGYVKADSGEFFVHVSAGQATLLKQTAGVSITDWQPEAEQGLVVQLRQDNELTNTIQVGNTAGTALPQTGGPGTALYNLLGGLMVVTAGAVLTLRKKKNKA